MSVIKVLLIFALINSASLENKLNIEIFYESLCPDSFNFITKQLYPNYKEISEFVNINFVPFGKSASLDNGTKFICQHGPHECKGNKIMSCALNDISYQYLKVKYVNCFMEAFKYKQHENVHKCAELAELSRTNIESCYKSDLGNYLQLLAEEKTSKVLPRFIPTIIYNGEFNQQLQDASLVDFKAVVCQLVKNTSTKVCK